MIDARSAALSSYRTPGVRVEWLDAAEQQPTLVRTDVTGLVGVTERGPLHRPVLVESYEQFVGVFGGRQVQAYLPYAVEGFFANGGRTGWVVRVADPARARPAQVTLPAVATGYRSLRLTATSPGTWGNRVRVTRRPDPLAIGRFSLLLRQGAVSEIWRDLTDDPADPRDAARLLGSDASGSRLVVADWLPSGNDPEPESDDRQVLAGGDDGLETLTPRHFVGHQPPSDDPWGVAALAAIDEVSLICVPDCWTPPRRIVTAPAPRPVRCADLSVPLGPPETAEPSAGGPSGRAVFGPEAVAVLQQEVIDHCESRGDRVALLDAPALPLPDVLSWRAASDRTRSGFDTSYAALYYPWLQIVDPDSELARLRAVPPSGHIAGICARVDRTTGVHKPPAGETVELAVDTEIRLDDIGHGDLNDAGINAIRADRSVRVMGARTLSRLPGSSGRAPGLRYLNVRRLLLMIEESIDRASRWTVFEPNGPRLWAEMDRLARGVLEQVWRAGMLNGATRSQAYSVTCDASVNPVEQTLTGQLVCLVGVNPPVPAEFVVVRIVRSPTGLVPSGSSRAAGSSGASNG